MITAPRARSLRAAATCLGAVALSALYVANAAAAPVTAPTTISAVAVYTDRAQVTRVGSVDLGSSGQAEIAIDGLPGWIDQESIRVTLSRGQILDVAPKTTHLAKSALEPVRKAEEAVQEINDKLRVINDEKAVVNAELQQLRSLRAFTTKDIPRNATVRRVSPKEMAATLDFIAARMKAANAKHRELDGKARELYPELNKRNKDLAELRSRSTLKHTQIVVGVKGTGKVKLKLVYMTPGVAWEPGAELRVKGAERAHLVQHALVINNSGEDWNGAKLSFSTQRPGEMLQVPEAKALLLGEGAAKGGIGTVVGSVGQSRSKSFAAASSGYLQMNRANTQTRGVFEQNYRRQQETQRRAQQAFAKLQQRGTTAHFQAQVQRSVRTDGKPVRVPITEATFAMTTRVVAVPEVSLNAVRTAQLTNTSKQPVLPGVASLFVDGAFLGKSQLDFVAPGESFAAFLGVDQRIKLKREIDRNRAKIERGSKRTTVKASFLIRIENLSDDTVKVQITDRVPVAQSEDIEIDDVEIPKGSSRSRDGLVRWTATMRPKLKMVYRIQYELEYPNSMAAQARKQRVRRFKNKRKPAPAPARSTKEYLFDQIDALENAL